ncbi:hypothetical protein MUP77_12910, partial [Candidatus Bathyarchaeota archaeon]|nr:hypothetical protein [Candidatus Bathyarchaeota archaeon]
DVLAYKLSMPDGYLVEALVVALINQQGEEKVMFPYEIRIDAFEGIKGKVEERVDVLRQIGNASESYSFLAELGLKDIAEELSQGYARFESGDYDGAIKAYRKVVEGFRNHFQKKEEPEGKKSYRRLLDGSESRTEKMIEFLSKTYSLLSNFGEHYGTHAFDEEGVFTRKMVENLTEYLTKKLKVETKV